MSFAAPHANEVFGWCWILAGLASGAVLGLRFRQEDWLGGYASWPRRLLRLGHVAMVALGMLNVLFAQSWTRLRLGPAVGAAAGWLLVAGAVAMPLCCAVNAFRPRRERWFAVPVASLLLGVALTAWGLS